MSKLKNMIYAGVGMAALLILGIHAYIGGFTRLIADDFCSAYLFPRLGLLRYIWYWYKGWAGRYSAFAADMVLVGLGRYGIAYLTLLVICVWLLAIFAIVYLLQKSEIRNSEKRKTALTFSLATLFLIFLLTPNPDQSFYWFSGFHTHTLPVIGFTVLLALYLWLRKFEPAKTKIYLSAVLGFVFSFLIGGFSETFTVLAFVFWGSLLLRLFVRKEMNVRGFDFQFLVMAWLGTTLALLVVLASPGNEIRQALFPATPDIFTILRISSVGFFDWIWKIVALPRKILGLTGVLMVLFWSGFAEPFRLELKKWEVPAMLLMGFLLAFLSFPPAVYGTSESPPSRVLIIPVFAFVLAVALFAYGWGNRANSGGNISRFCSKYSFLPMILSAVLVLTSAGLEARYLLARAAIYANYAAYWDVMDQQIMHAKQAGQTSVIIHSERNWAGLNDPGNNPKFWVTACISKYYDINVLADDTGMQLGPVGVYP